MSVRRALSGFVLGCSISGCIAPAPAASGSPATAGPAAVARAPAHALVWPHGTRAAVSLTYDDAIQSQIDNAVPALGRHALPATFFLTGSSPYLLANPDVYRGLIAAGHELGSHTMNHPCDRAQSWVKPGFGLQDYDLERMQQELAGNIEQLKNLGQKEPFSFAYPCGSTWLGEMRQSYVPLVAQSFSAARGVSSRVADPGVDSLLEVPSTMANQSAAELTSWVDRALSSGGWVVFTFHGVAGDYLPVAADAHEALLAYLELHKSSVWTERFGTVAGYIKAQQLAPAP